MIRQSFVPPQSVMEAAARGLRWRQTHRRGGTAVGVARARDLSGARPVSIRTLKRMRAYFTRHEVDANAMGWFYGEPGFPSAGRIAWELWGGDPGRRWAERMLASLD